MKISENWSLKDGKIVHQQTHDFTPTLQINQSLKSAGVQGFSDSKLVGVIDHGIMRVWAKEAGIKGSDPDYWTKMKEVVKRKLLDGDNKKLRVWEGTY